MTARKRPRVASARGATTRRAGAGRQAPQFPREVLQRVASGVAGAWPRADQARVSPGDLAIAVRILADAVEAAWEGRPPVVAGIPPFVDARRLLDHVRRAWVDLEERPAVTDADVLAVARAMDRVAVALDADATHRFTARLGSFDAQQLVVEMAHDMRSPLGSILILAERLRAGAGGTLPPIQQRQVGLIYSAAFGLSALAGDVIELARGGASLMDAHPIPFSVSGVLQSIVDMLRPMAEEKHLLLRWEGPRANVRLGHPAALNRVLLNLATNAIKFTNVGEVVISTREPADDIMEFAVRDTGRGIPESVMANLFEAFRQRHTPGDYAFSSAGLGLSICQKLVRSMGGELRVDSELERGTEFSFRLPLAIADGGHDLLGSRG